MSRRARRIGDWIARGAVVAGLLGLGLGLGLGPDRVAAEEETGRTAVPVEAAVRIARAARGSILRVQWRPAAGRSGSEVVERHAVVVDLDGWLLLAGPPPSTKGTLAATLEDGRSMRVEVWASDPLTCLTLLRLPVVPEHALRIREPVEPGPTPGSPDTPSEPSIGPWRLPPDFPFVMVTAEGALARGSIRGNHRRRRVTHPDTHAATEVSCLDEAALSAVPTDLGAPWLDADGRIVGLLVGADAAPPPLPDATGDVRIRPEVTAAYAVPAEILRVVWPLLRERREVPRAALGVLAQQLSEETRHHLCPDCGGYEIMDLAPEGPAARARIHRYDVIRSIDGVRPAPGVELRDLLLPHRPGARIRVGLFRRGEPMDVDVVLGRAE